MNILSSQVLLFLCKITCYIKSACSNTGSFTGGEDDVNHHAFGGNFERVMSGGTPYGVFDYTSNHTNYDSMYNSSKFF